MSIVAVFSMEYRGRVIRYSFSSAQVFNLICAYVFNFYYRPDLFVREIRSPSVVWKVPKLCEKARSKVACAQDTDHVRGAFFKATFKYLETCSYNTLLLSVQTQAQLISSQSILRMTMIWAEPSNSKRQQWDRSIPPIYHASISGAHTIQNWCRYITPQPK